jgi:hypothetical protein
MPTRTSAVVATLANEGKTKLVQVVFGDRIMYIVSMVNSKAILSNDGCYISFSFNGRTIRFKGPYSLVKIAKVKEWDNGYLVVDAVYSQNKDKLVEDYIDLIPILKDLYIDPEHFLQPIKSVEVDNVRATA